MSVLPQTVPGPGGVPLSRRSSRLTSALTHAKSIDAHPPHHAHFDESPEVEIEAGPSRSRSNSSSRARVPVDNVNGDGGDLEKGNVKAKSVVDIEHVPVDDDPREWSNLKKNLVLTMMTISVVCSFFFFPIPFFFRSEIGLSDGDRIEKYRTDESLVHLSIQVYIIL
jgi:hypothetical protein